MVSDITFLWFLLFSMCQSLHVTINKCINWCLVHLYVEMITVHSNISTIKKSTDDKHNANNIMTVEIANPILLYFQLQDISAATFGILETCMTRRLKCVYWKY